MSSKLRLTVHSGQGRSVKDIDWNQLNSFLIGRSEGADLFLNDGSVSRKHCRLFAREDRLYVEDLGSRRGTRVNGETTSVEFVPNGAELQVGDVRIEIAFVNETAAAAPPPVVDGIDESHLPAPPSDEDAVTVAGNAVRKEPARARSYQVDLNREIVTLGRDRAACDLRLDDLNVSRRHFQVLQRNGAHVLRDLDSTNGTYLNGAPVRGDRRLREGDTIRAGSIQFTYDGRSLVSIAETLGLSISALNLAVPKPQTKGPTSWILRDITVTIRAGEFVGLLGTSGAGKSTLLRALSARSRPRNGQVIYDGEDLFERFASFRAGIGYAPQKDIFHESLPLIDALRFTSRLRLSKDASDQEIDENIDRVLELVELTERRDTVIKNLSGGQKRRVSIAIELLSNPRVLFLDEVTSGLDPYLEKQMMKLFRRLATEQGITIFIITHHANSADLCDRILYLNKGQLTFFGTPPEAKRFFAVGTFEEIYEHEGSKTPDQWRQQFERSGEYARYIADDSYHQNPGTGNRRGEEVDPTTDWPKLKRQFGLLTQRYLKVFLADRLNILVFCLGPVIALLLCVLTRSETVTDPSTFFQKQFRLCVGSTMIMFFLGIFGAVREVVKELDIYLHEHFTTVEILPYLASKIALLSGIGLAQSGAVLWILVHYGGMSLNASQGWMGAVLFVTYFAAMLLGLAISSAVPSSDLAIMAMLFFVMPQVLFGGALNRLEGPSGPAAFISKTFITSYWSLEAAKSLVADYSGSGAPGLVKASSMLPTQGFKKGAGLVGLHGAIFAAASILLLAAKDGNDRVKTVGRIAAVATGRTRS